MKRLRKEVEIHKAEVAKEREERQRAADQADLLGKIDLAASKKDPMMLSVAVQTFLLKQSSLSSSSSTLTASLSTFLPSPYDSIVYSAIHSIGIFAENASESGLQETDAARCRGFRDKIADKAKALIRLCRRLCKEKEKCVIEAEKIRTITNKALAEISPEIVARLLANRESAVRTEGDCCRP